MFTPLSRGQRIVNADGTPTQQFVTLMQRITSAFADTDAAVAAVRDVATSASATASAASVEASGAAAGLPVKSISGGPFNITSDTRQTIGVIDLQGVTSGTLRFDTTALFASASGEVVNGDVFNGRFWIAQELTAGGELADVYSDTFRLERIANIYGGTLFFVMTFDATALNAARPAVISTGDVTYRLQVARDSGTSLAGGVTFNFLAGQAS